MARLGTVLCALPTPHLKSCLKRLCTGLPWSFLSIMSNCSADCRNSVEVGQKLVPSRLLLFGCSVVSDSFATARTVVPRLLYPWDFPGKNTGVGYHFLLQGIFPTQGSNLCLLLWQEGSLPLSHQGSPATSDSSQLVQEEWIIQCSDFLHVFQHSSLEGLQWDYALKNTIAHGRHTLAFLFFFSY